MTDSTDDDVDGMTNDLASAIGRHAYLPHLGTDVFVTDGGLETTLIFLEGIELPEFAAFVLLGDDEGRARLRDYYRSHGALSRTLGMGMVIDTPTWRASADWGTLLGYDAERLRQTNQQAVQLVREVRAEFQTADNRIVLSGCVGPRGDGYDPGVQMTAEQAAAYHLPQIVALAGAGVDLITALTLSYPAEAIGVTTAAQVVGIDIAIAFTVETDGGLPDGHTLGDAITAVDAATESAPAYYMINCAHPTHFADALPADASWVERVRGVRANASTACHAELDNAETLDDGDPADLGDRLAGLRQRFPQITLVGGCCGTDERHIEHIGQACR